MKVKPFKITISDSALADLHDRLARTRWPDHPLDDGWSRGVPIEYLKGLAETWRSHFDWRKQEAKLNEHPQFVAEIDSQPVHFLHIRSDAPDAVPLLMAHGYPGSFVDFLPMIDPLVNPAASGGKPAQAFHLVIPSLPGFGFSTPVTAKGWEISRMANAFDQIMQALGYERYGVHGGDVGAGVCEQLCIQAGDRVIGSLVTTDPAVIATEYTPPTDHLSEKEKKHLDELKAARREDFGYIQIQATRPQTIGYSLTDSPVGQLAWIVEKFKEWTDSARDLPEDAVDIDHLLTNVSIYWFGQGGAGAAAFLYESMHAAAAWGQTHSRPVGFVSFGEEPLVRRILDPEKKQAYWNEHERGGHFPSYEQPDLLVGDLRKFFSSLS